MKFLAMTAVALAIATPALADEGNFNGPRGGVQIGYQSDKIDSVALFADAGLGTVTSTNSKKDGVTIQATLGYDAHVFDNFVVGAELAGAYSPGENKQVVTFSSDPANPVSINYKSDLTFEATLRAGITVTPNALLYVKGGYANTRLEAAITVPTGGLASPTLVSGNNSGWVVGGGVEYAFTPKISGRIEYKYFDFEGPRTRQQVVAGLGYSF